MKAWVTGRRDASEWVIASSVKVGAKLLRNEGEVNRNWQSCGFEWDYSGQGPRCLAYSMGVAYYKRRRKLARWLLAEEAMGVLAPMIYNAGRKDLCITFDAVRAALVAADLPS